MASRSLLRLARPDRPPMHLYRIITPYRPALLQYTYRQLSTAPKPLVLKLDMSNPIYRDLIKSIKNPFVGDLIHKLVQGDISFSQSLFSDFPGAGSSLYFRIPDLPYQMRGHEKDPDGIPLPPNTFRVSSVEELRTILSQILEFRTDMAQYSSTSEQPDRESADPKTVNPNESEKEKRDTPTTGPRDAAAASESVGEKKQDARTTCSSAPEAPETPTKGPNETFDSFKARFKQQFTKPDKNTYGQQTQNGVVASALESLEKQLAEIGEQLRSGNVSARYNKFLKEELRDKINELAKFRRKYLDDKYKQQIRREIMDGASLKAMLKGWTENISKGDSRSSPQGDSKAGPSKAYTYPELDLDGNGEVKPWVLVRNRPSVEKKTENENSRDQETPERRKAESDINSVDTIEQYIARIRKEAQEKRNDIAQAQNEMDEFKPVTERVTLMDILNGKSSMPAQNEGSDQAPEPKASKSIPTLEKDEIQRNTVSAEQAEFREQKAALNEADHPAQSPPPAPERTDIREPEIRQDESINKESDYQRFVDHMDEVLATQYSDLRDYFEERVLSETRDVAARVGSLENTMQKILENQEAAAKVAAAQAKEGACIYSTESPEPGVAPNVPVTVKLDEADKSAIDQVVDLAVERLSHRIEDMSTLIVNDVAREVTERFDEFVTPDGWIAKAVDDIIHSDKFADGMDERVTIIVEQVLEELGKDPSGDLQRIMDRAVKEGMSDMEDGLRKRVGDIQLKLFTMEKMMKEARKKPQHKGEDKDEGWFNW